MMNQDREKQKGLIAIWVLLVLLLGMIGTGVYWIAGLKDDSSDVLAEQPVDNTTSFETSNEKVLVIDVTGQMGDEALSELDAIGLQSVIEEVYSCEDNGLVIATIPGSGSMIEISTPVTIFISKGKDPNPDVVHIPDLEFKRAIIESLKLELDPIRDSIQKQMVKNVNDLYVSNQGIRDLEGISAFENLRYLYADHNEIVTMPLLANSIVYVDVSYNQIEEMNLYHADYFETLIANHNHLSHFPECNDYVREIDVANNLISEIYPVAGLYNLLKLDISHNLISDFSPLDWGDFHLMSLKTEGNDVECSYEPGRVIEGLIYNIQPTNQLSTVMETKYSEDYFMYYQVIGYPSFIINTMNGAELIGTFPNPYEFNDSQYNLYKVQAQATTWDFYVEVSSDTCAFCDVYGNIIVFGEDERCAIGTGRYTSILSLLGCPSAMREDMNYVYMDYYFNDIIISFVMNQDGVLQFLRVASKSVHMTE